MDCSISNCHVVACAHLQKTYYQYAPYGIAFEVSNMNKLSSRRRQKPSTVWVSDSSKKTPNTITVELEDGLFVAKTRDLKVISGTKERWRMLFRYQARHSWKTVEGLIPTELLVASMGLCATIHLLIGLSRHKLPIEGAKIELSWCGDTTVGELINTIWMDIIAPGIPKDVSQEVKDDIIREVYDCNVAAAVKLPPKIIVSLNL
jgi:uncharacterized OsmC-like protein